MVGFQADDRRLNPMPAEFDLEIFGEVVLVVAECEDMGIEFFDECKSMPGVFAGQDRAVHVRQRGNSFEPLPFGLNRPLALELGNNPVAANSDNEFFTKSFSLPQK